ncbi:haloacid dehalogenase-like hydrolase family protein [Cryptosporidium felis]|nr:haloacid dehalogenase-like hydrolase family protein [Cryptosporidium felis]
MFMKYKFIALIATSVFLGKAYSQDLIDVNVTGRLNISDIGIQNITDVNLTDLPIISIPSIYFEERQTRNLRTKKDKKFDCPFKCIISDLDGSLGEVGAPSISTSNSLSLSEVLSSNIKFFPATGRSFTSSMKFLAGNIKNSVFTGFPGVYYNGALVFGPGGIKDVLFDIRIHPDNALEILKFIRKFAVLNESYLRFESSQNGNSQYVKTTNEKENGETVSESLRLLNVAIETPSGMFVDGFEGSNMKKYMAQEIDSLVHKGVNLSKFLEPREGEKINGLFKIVVVESSEVLLSLREHLETFVRMYGCKVYRSVPNVLEIIPEGASKLNGVKSVVKRLKTKLREIVYLGDGENDVEAMSKVGFPVAVSGSSPAVSFVSRTIQTFPPDLSLSSLMGEYCEPIYDKKK